MRFLNIRAKRIEKNMTQAEIAARIGVNQNTVSQWETGERMPRAVMIIQLAKVLDCTVDELLNG